jgi:DNA-binding NarL/FixJ family response regulator
MATKNTSAGKPAAGGQEATKRKVFIVDDHPIVRQGLVQLFNNEPDFAVCGQAEEAYAALRSIKDAKPDLVLLDVNMPGMGGLETCRAIRSDSDVAVIMLTVRNTD